MAIIAASLCCSLPVAQRDRPAIQSSWPLLGHPESDGSLPERFQLIHAQRTQTATLAQTQPSASPHSPSPPPPRSSHLLRRFFPRLAVIPPPLRWISPRDDDDGGNDRSSARHRRRSSSSPSASLARRRCRAADERLSKCQRGIA